MYIYAEDADQGLNVKLGSFIVKQIQNYRYNCIGHTLNQAKKIKGSYDVLEGKSPQVMMFWRASHLN
jgi:hypothetical protein